MKNTLGGQQMPRSLYVGYVVNSGQARARWINTCVLTPGKGRTSAKFAKFASDSVVT